MLVVVKVRGNAAVRPAFYIGPAPNCAAMHSHVSLKLGRIAEQVLLQGITDSAALTKRVIMDNTFNTHCSKPISPGHRPTTCTCAMAMWERDFATDTSPDWFSRSVFNGQLTVPFGRDNVFGQEGSFYYTDAAQLQGEVEILYTLNHVQRIDTGLESHNITITFMRDEVPIALFFEELNISKVFNQQVYHGQGSWTITPIWPAIGVLNISVPAHLLLGPPTLFLGDFSGLVASELGKRFRVLDINHYDSSMSSWHDFAVNPEGMFDIEQLSLLEGKSDFELQVNQFTIRCIFATRNRVIARFEVTRVVSPLDKVALANIRGSGIWSDEP